MGWENGPELSIHEPTFPAATFKHLPGCYFAVSLSRMHLQGLSLDIISRTILYVFHNQGLVWVCHHGRAGWEVTVNGLISFRVLHFCLQSTSGEKGNRKATFLRRYPAAFLKQARPWAVFAFWLWEWGAVGMTHANELICVVHGPGNSGIRTLIACIRFLFCYSGAFD